MRRARSGALRDRVIGRELLAISGIALLLIWIPLVDISASAQSGTDSFDPLSRPTLGGTSGTEYFNESPSFQAATGHEILRHRDFAGRPCLAVGGFAEAHAIDPNLYDDVISVTNNCPERIAVQVCYYQSVDCILMDIPGQERKEAILGMLPSTKDFRFEFREKF